MLVKVNGVWSDVEWLFENAESILDLFEEQASDEGEDG